MKRTGNIQKAPTDDLSRFWRSEVKVTAGRRGQILWTPYLIHKLLDQSRWNLRSITIRLMIWLYFGGQRSQIKVSRPPRWRRHPRRCCGVEVYLFTVIVQCTVGVLSFSLASTRE